MNILQHTVSDKITFKGIGLHTGAEVRVDILPAPEDTGIVFVRKDKDPNYFIEANAQNIVNTLAATTIGKNGITISTIEHLMAAIYGIEIDNAIIQVEGPEIPALDGSAGIFVKKIKEIGLKEQKKPRRFLKILQTISIEDDDKFIMVEPYDSFGVDVEIQFTHSVIGRQRYTCKHITSEEFERNISKARTFGFLSQVAEMRKNGLARGGSEKNAIVIGDTGVLNSEGLRFKNEMARHKALDLIGDLALLGGPLLAKITAKKNGHELHRRLMLELITKKDAMKYVSFEALPQIDNDWIWESQAVAAAF